MKFHIGSAASALALLALAGCGGGGDPYAGHLPIYQPTDSLPVAQSWPPLACASNGKVVKIQLFGDSTQYGFDGWTGATALTTPTTALQAEMDALFGAGAVVVDNRAVSGTTSTQLLNGADGLNGPWPASVSGDIVVVNHGINDARDGVALTDYQQNLTRLTSAGSAIVLLETPNPVHDWPFESDPYALAMTEVGAATNHQVIDTSAFVESIPQWQGVVPDGVHPDAYLYAQIAQDALAPALVPIVAGLRCR